MKIKKLNESHINKLNNLPSERGISKVSYELIKEYQNILKSYPVGKILRHRIDAGEEIFTKIEDGEYGWWEHHRAPWGDKQRISEFDMAEWLAGRAVISRSDIIEENLNDMKIKKLNESSAPSKETLDDCLQDYVNNAFGYDGVEDYVDTQYPMHPQEFKAEVINYLKQNIINESISESISSQEPVVKFTGRSSHTFTKDKKWEVDFDEKGNILARTRKGKPQYFKGHINDKTNSFPSTDEDNIILAAREQHSLKFGKGSVVTESTHAVCYSLDGGRTEEIEFEGTEDECYQYIEDTQAEQDTEFGVDAPERFIKRLTEATQVKEALNESRPDKYDYQNNSTNKLTIKYGNSNKEIKTCKPIKVTNDQLKQYKDNYSFVDIIEESKSISEDNSYECKPNISFKHIKRNKIEEDIDDEKQIVQRYLDVELPDILSRLIDYLPKMYESDIKIVKNHCRRFYDQLNSMLSYYVAHKDGTYIELEDTYIIDELGFAGAVEIKGSKVCADEETLRQLCDAIHSEYGWQPKIEESLNESNVNLEDRYNTLLSAYGRELRDLMNTNKDGCNDDKIKEMQDKITEVKKKISSILKEHVEITALEGPKEGPKVGLSSLLTDAIKDEWEAIETYNSLAVTARAEGFEDIANKIDEINTDENTHVGKLQELLKTISPNAEAIDFGQKYANDIDDDMSEDDVLAYTDRYM